MSPNPVIRCTASLVKRARRKSGSWRKAAEALNRAYGVRLSHLVWWSYAMGRRDITDPRVRARLQLPPRVCPSCGQVIMPGNLRRRSAERSN